MTSRRLFLVPAVAAALAAGCQQRMADQPAPRPYEKHEMFPHEQSLRPLERGVVHRSARLGDEPLGDWLTAEGRKGAAGSRAGEGSPDSPGNGPPPVGAPSRDPRSGRPEDKLFVDEFPFEVSAGDLARGQSLFNANCALCHGAAGYGNGKIPERGVLRPPSYHQLGDGVRDYSTMGADAHPKYTAMPAGFSRGYYRWGIEIPLREVPVGYLFQVITWGYGAMAAHETQVPYVADRWRVVAYLRTLQLSQAVREDGLTPEVRAAADSKATATNGAGAKGQAAAGGAH